MEEIFKIIKLLITHSELEPSNKPSEYCLTNVKGTVPVIAYLKGQELRMIPVKALLKGTNHIFVNELFFSKKEGNLTLYIKVPEPFPTSKWWRKIIIELSLESIPKICQDYNVTQEMMDTFLGQLLGSLQNKYITDKYNKPIIEKLRDLFLPTKYETCSLSLRITEDINWEAAYLTSDPKQQEFKTVANTLGKAILELQSKIILNDFSKLSTQVEQLRQTL